jgi:hypothetical protein
MNITMRQFLKAASMAAAAVACGAPIASAQFVEKGIMPPPREETIPTAPGPEHHWVRGHWVWHNSRVRWEWAAGQYVHGEVPAVPADVVEVIPARPGPPYFWVKGHYVWEDGRWVWHRGLWAR